MPSNQSSQADQACSQEKQHRWFRQGHHR